MEPKQYNEKIYNKGVVLLREKIRTLEEQILNGNIKVNNLHDFNRVYEEVNEVWQELSDLYYESSDDKYIDDLNTYFASENEFLKEYMNCLKIFHNYHEAAGEMLINDTLIKQEWEDIVNVLSFRKVSKELKSVESFFWKAEATFNFSNWVQGYDLPTYTKTTEQKWQDIVKMQCFRNLQEQMALVEATRKGNMYFRIKDLNDILEKNLYESVFPRLKTKMANTDFWDKQRNIGVICKEIIEKNTRNAIQSFDRLLTLAEDPDYYAEQVKEILEKNLDNTISSKELRSKEYQAERKKDIYLDQKFYDQLTSDSKIKYLRLLLQNIIKKTQNGNINRKNILKVRIDGKVYKYQKRYQELVTNYMALLTSLEEEKAKNKTDIIQEMTKEESGQDVSIDEIMTERYAELKAKQSLIQHKMHFLEEEAKSYLDKDQIVSFISDVGEVFVLESSYNKYQELYNKKKSIEAAIKEIDIKQGHVYDDSDEKYYANVCFSKENETEDKESADAQRKFWKKKFFQAYKGKKNAQAANVKTALKMMNIPEKFQNLYMHIAVESDEFLKSKKYSDETKRKAFGNLRSIFTNYMTKKNSDEKLNQIVAEANDRVIQSLAMLPVDKTKAYKVFANKKTKDIAKLNERRIRMQKMVINTSKSAAVFCSLIIIELNALNAIAPIVPRAKSSVSVEKTEEFDSLAKNELNNERNVDDILTAGVQADLWVDKLIKFNQQNTDWKISYVQDEENYEMASIKNSKEILVENQTVTEDTIDVQNVGMYDFVYLKPGAKVFSTYYEGIQDVNGKECTADITTPYKITGIGYQNGVWVSAESNEYDPVAMYRAYDAQEIPKAVVRLVNPTTDEYIGYVICDSASIEVSELTRGGR